VKTAGPAVGATGELVSPDASGRAKILFGPLSYLSAKCFSQAKLVPAVKPHTHSNGARETTSPDMSFVVLVI
jgi:hypothetical protein